MVEETLPLDGVHVLRWKPWLAEIYGVEDEWPEPEESLTDAP